MTSVNLLMAVSIALLSGGMARRGREPGRSCRWSRSSGDGSIQQVPGASVPSAGSGTLRRSPPVRQAAPYVFPGMAAATAIHPLTVASMSLASPRRSRRVVFASCRVLPAISLGTVFPFRADVIPRARFLLPRCEPVDTFVEDWRVVLSSSPVRLGAGAGSADLLADPSGEGFGHRIGAWSHESHPIPLNVPRHTHSRQFCSPVRLKFC